MQLINPTPSPRVTLAPARPAQGMRGQVGAIPPKFGVALAVIDMLALYVAAIAAAWATVALQRHILHTPTIAAMTDMLAVRRNIYLSLCLVSLVMFWNKGLYTRRMPWWSQVQYIGKVMFLAFLIQGFISFALKIQESRLLITSNWLFAFCFVVGFRRLASLVAARSQWWKIPTVVIGDNAMVTDLIYAFNADPYAGYKVHTVFLRDRDHRGFSLSNLPRECRDIEVRNGMVEYESYIATHPEDFYVVALDAFRGETRDRLINLLDQAEAGYAIVPSINRMGLYEMEPYYFFGHDVMLLQVRTPGVASSPARIVKRAMDIFIAGMALVLLLPIFATVAVMLKVEGQGGSVFYGGRRIGYRGKFFRCWKFRSMEPDSDHRLHAYLNANPLAKANWEKYRKLPNDPRVTTYTARLIRKLSIDELPQLWNVLAGDMSLVGPRPILEDEQHYFGDTLKEYLSVRPGLTGLWQVSGRNATSFLRRVYWDSWYVRNWSLWNDIIILIKTPMVLLSRKGAH